MDWVSVGDRLPGEEDGTYQLVVYLNPFMGKFSAQMTVAYFDDPENYENPEMAEGWKDWHTENKILVTHWQRLPQLPVSEFDGIDQLEFNRCFGVFRPNLGCVYSANPSPGADAL